MNPCRPEMADIVRTHHNVFLARWNRVLSRQQRKALRDIRDCRTAALGGRLEQCDQCGHRVILYNSCGNRSCPKCQAKARARWLAQREAELLAVPYFHVVFTLPAQIGKLALQNPKQIYTLLFRCAARSLLETAADPRLLGAQIGFLAVLHTWGQNLHLHPHLHCVVPGGGISRDGSRWIRVRKSSFFLPVRVLGHRFRKLFLRSLRGAFRHGALHFHVRTQTSGPTRRLPNALPNGSHHRLGGARQTTLWRATPRVEVSGPLHSSCRSPTTACAHSKTAA